MTRKKSDKKFETKHKAKPNTSGTVTITLSAKSLMTFIDAIASLHNEARIYVTENGIKVFMVDPGNVAMLCASLECKIQQGKKPLEMFGLNTLHIKKLLLYSKGHTVTLSVSDTDIALSYGRFSGKCCVEDMTYFRKDPNKEPDMILNAHFDMPGSYLYETSSIFGKNGKVVFETDDKVIYLKTECGDIEFREVVGTISDKKKEQIHSIFSGDYIAGIAKIVKDSPIHVDVGIDHPIVITTEKDDCSIRFLLAPRIESD